MSEIDSFTLIEDAIRNSIKLDSTVVLAPDTKLRNALVVNSIDFLKIFSFMEDALDMDLVDDAGEETVENISTLIEYIDGKRALLSS